MWHWHKIWLLFCLLGYCGADIKALCAETGLCALRHCYPQLYESRERLQMNMDSIKIKANDFSMAMQKTVPASQRVVPSPGRALSAISKPLLENTLERILQTLQRVFPHAELALKKDQQQGITLTSTCFCSGRFLDLWFVQFPLFVVQSTYTNVLSCTGSTTLYFVYAQCRAAVVSHLQKQ